MSTNTLLDESRYGKISLFEDSKLPAVKMPPPSLDDYNDQDNEFNKEVTSYVHHLLDEDGNRKQMSC
jgi:hypothetical protein